MDESFYRFQCPKADAVLDCTNSGVWYGHIDKALEAAKIARKSWILWNDRVYWCGGSFATQWTIKDLENANG